MDEQLTSQLTEAASRLAAATEALEKALGRIEAQQEKIGAKVERIVAAIDERTAEPGSTELQQRLAELERENNDLKAQAGRALRKTLPPLVSTLLTKGGMDDSGARIDESVLDKALASLSLEQRIAVKAEMARAGMID